MDFIDFPRKFFFSINTFYNNLLSIFLLYFNDKIMESIVFYINSYIRIAENPSQPNSRANDWYEIILNKIYLFLGIHIIMVLHPEYKKENFWRFNIIKTKYGFIIFISKNRFFEFLIQYKIGLSTSRTIFEKMKLFIFRN